MRQRLMGVVVGLALATAAPAAPDPARATRWARQALRRVVTDEWGMTPTTPETFGARWEAVLSCDRFWEARGASETIGYETFLGLRDRYPSDPVGASRRLDELVGVGADLSLLDPAPTTPATWKRRWYDTLRLFLSPAFQARATRDTVFELGDLRDLQARDPGAAAVALDAWLARWRRRLRQPAPERTKETR